MKNKSSALRVSLALLVLASFSAACGGNYVPSDDGTDGTGNSASDEGSGGSAQDGGTGGSNQGSGGAPSGTGGAGTGGEPPTCCLAEAVCDDFDQQIESEGDCPVGAECYSRTMCCSTVWCMEEQALCDAIPTCLEGETEVAMCPEDAVCTPRALCGQVIVCQQNDVTCAREDEPDRNYVAESPGTCVLIDFGCPEHTTMFANDCGCGCEQPSECPDSVDCEPGASTDPLCDSDECPYSARAL